MNNAEMKHVFNTDVINAAVATAMAGWAESHPNATAEEGKLAEADIRSNILASRTKDKFLNSKANRAARRAHIAEEAAKHGLMFTSATDLTSVPDTFEMTEKERKGIPILSIVIEEFINSFGLTKEVERTVTFCFKTEDIGYRHTGIKIAMSFQNPADEPDALVAREYALARFLDGKVVEVAMPSIVIEKLGINAAVRECLNSNVPALYAAKFL